MHDVRILIADDHAIVRSGLRVLLSSHPEFTVVGEANDGREAVQRALDLEPDLVIMDLSMPPGLDGISATIHLKKADPDIGVLILTMHDDEEYAYRVLQAGASGYIVKNALETELISAIRAVSKGDVYLHPSVAKWLVEDLLDSVHRGEQSDVNYGLTDREREVLTLIAKGYGNKEAAELLSISVKTVESHRARIMEKLNLHTRPELVDYAIQKGLLDLDYAHSPQQLEAGESCGNMNAKNKIRSGVYGKESER